MEKDVRLSRLKKKQINDRRTESEGQKSGLCVKDKGGSHQASLSSLCIKEATGLGSRENHREESSRKQVGRKKRVKDPLGFVHWTLRSL